MNRKPIAVLVMVAEVLAGYLALIAGLMSAWMVDDREAFHMRDMDWVVEGCRRLVVVLFVSAARLAPERQRRWTVR